MASPETTQPETGSPSLAEQLAEAFAEADTDETETEIQDVQAEPESVEETAEAEADVEIEATDEDVEEDAPESTPESVEPLEHWSKDLKESFTDLPDDAKSFVMDREKEFQADHTRKTQEIAEVRKAFDPYRQALDLAGMTEAQAIRQLLAAQSFLQSNPKDGLRKLAQGYGLDVNFGDDPAAAQEDDPYLDPQVKKLQQELAEVRNQLQSTTQQITSTDQQSALAQIQAFKDEADTDGNLLHPHFDKLKITIGGFIQAGVAADLQDAYDKAVLSLPEYKDELVSRLEKEAQEKAQTQRAAKAAKAKKRARSVKPAGKAPTADAKQAKMDIAGALNAAWDEASE